MLEHRKLLFIIQFVLKLPQQINKYLNLFNIFVEMMVDP